MNTEKLFLTYKKEKKVEQRNQLITHYMPLVKKVVNVMPQSQMSYLEKEDLESYGYFGLIDAIEKYDPSRNVKFETYASTRIRGAIIDHLRKQDILPRSIRDKQKKIENFIQTYQNKYDKMPSDEEIVKKTDLTKKDLSKVYTSTTLSNMASLEELVRLKVDVEDDFESPSSILESKDFINALANAIDSLTEREQKVIAMYYYEEISLKEISYVLEVSESRISQILSKTMLKLKKQLQNYR